MYHSRVIAQLIFGEIRVDYRQRQGVKRQIHAAYHGYSHLSGIEMTSALLVAPLEVAPFFRL